MSVWKQKTTSKGGEFEKPPAGNHAAVLVAIIDMGTQEQEYQGERRSSHRAYFVWELVNEKMSGTTGTNHLIGIDLTVSLNVKSKLRAWIEARAGRKMPDDLDYDISQELGKPCYLNVTVNANGFPKIEGLAAVPRGVQIPAPQRTPFQWTLEDYAKGTELPDWLPYFYGEKLADVVLRCEEIAGKAKPAPTPPKPQDKPQTATVKDNGSPVGSSDADPIPW